MANPVSLLVDTQGTGVISDDALAKIVREQFDLRPAGIIDMLNLRRPIYRQTAAFGHFGRTDVDLPWERVDTRRGAARGGRHLIIPYAKGHCCGWFASTNALLSYLENFIRAEARMFLDFRFARGDIQRSLVGVGDKTGGGSARFFDIPAQRRVNRHLCAANAF
ncbi:MAG: methionine adenosyltransferase domain-containing protein [Christensenellales bacterium]